MAVTIKIQVEMEIETEGRRTLIQPKWNRYNLQENLQKIGLSLTSIHAATGQQISIIDSLATCLIQHASNRYDGISNLDEAWESVISKETKEEDWIQFRIRLEKKRQELLTLSINNYQNFKTVVDEVILALDEFQWFQLTSSRPIQFTLFADEWKIEIADNSRDSSTMAKCFIWYDKEFETFNGITKWSQTFADPQVYRLALVCQLDQSLKNFFRLLLSHGNPNDDELLTRITGYLKDITNSGRKIEDHEALLVQWNCSDDGLKILIKDLLNPDFVEGNRRDEIENELRKEFIESMEKATEEIQIERLESYEKFRLEAIAKKDESERKKRRLNSQIKESEGEIARLEQELTIEEESNTTTGRTDKTPKLQKSGSQLSRAAMLVLTKRNNLQKKKEKLAWDRFLSLLGGSLPRYELALQRSNHRLFGDLYGNVTDFADDIINEFVLKETFIKKGGDISNLMSFIRHNTSDAKTDIVHILEDMVKEPMQNTTNPTWKFDGNVLVLSQILDKVKPKMPLTCEEIHICAASVLYIDCDWVIPGISLGISSPRVETVGQRKIDTSGHHAKQNENKDARDGVGPGVNGDKGLPGGAGQSAGHVSIQCDTFCGSKLSIRACGGNGANGQNGGDGMPGSDGKDGEDAKLKPKAEVDQNFSYIPLTLLKYFVPGWNLYEMSRSVVHYYQGSQFAIKYLEKGSIGEPGISGGSGGSGGRGGEGGSRGKIDIQCQLGSNLIEPVVAEDGDDGKNGTSGKGATGGKGGRNGWDAARVFTPNDLNPWFYISGDWVEEEGNLSIEDVHCTSNNAVLGCKIVKKSRDKGVAADGEHGKDGQQSESSEKNKTVSKKTMSKVNADWKKQESTASMADLEQSIQADAASLQSAEAAAQRHEELSKASEENEKQAKAAAQQQQASEEKLKHAKEIEERIKKEFQQAKKMCTAQSMQSQRTNRITDQLPNESEPKEAEEELFSSSDSTIQTIPITSSDEWDSLEGVSLLDALIEKFSEDAEKSQTLSMLTQSLVLQIHQKDLWIEVTDIVRRHVDCVDDLIQSLKYINQDIELAQLFVFNKEEHLLDDLQCAIRDKTSRFTLFHGENKKKTLATIYYFQQLTWDYKEIGTLIKPLEIDSSKEKSPSNAKIQLIDILGHRLVSIVASLLPGNQEKQQKLLKDLFECCRRNNNSPPVLFGTFFNNLVTALQINTTSDTIMTILNKFIQEKLGVVRVQDLLPSKMKIISPEQLDKVAFLLNNVKTDVKDLDDIRSRVTTLLEKNKVEEKKPFKTVLFLIEKAFEQFYWNQEWNEIQKILIRDAFQDSVDRLKQALTWTYCRKSYQQKLDVCNELKKRFKNTDWKDLIKIVMGKASKLSFEKTVRFLQSIQWIKKREIDITGSFKDQDGKSDKDCFMEFVNRLLQVEPKKITVELMRPQLKRALHWLYHNHFVSFSAVEITSLNNLFDKKRFGQVRDDSFCRDEADFRTEYFLNWKERYFLRWTDCYNEMIAFGKKSGETGKKIVSTRILLPNQQNLFLSPTESVEQWQSLSKEPPEKLEQCIKTRIWQNFSQIFQQLTADVVTGIKQLTITLKIGTVPDIQQLSNENYQQFEQNLLKLLDSLVTVAVQYAGPEKEKRLSLLLSNVELLILCQVGLDDSDPTRTSNIISQLEDWKESINLMRKNQSNIENESDTCKSLSKILNSIFWSITGDESLSEELLHKDQQNRQDVERAIVSLDSFVGHLMETNEIEDQQLLVDKQIDIWNNCVSKKKFHSSSKSAVAFLEVLLTSSSHSMLKLRLAVAAQLLDHHMKTSEDVAVLERWSESIATISSMSEVQTDKEIFNQLVAVQISLIRHFTAFQQQRLKQKKCKKSIEFNFKEIINQLSIVANFLGQSEVKINHLILGGLMHLAKAMDVIKDELNPSHFLAQYIQHLYSVNKKEAIKMYGLKKQAIIQVLYSNDNKGQQHQDTQVFTTLERAYVERWLQIKSCFQSNDRIVDLYNRIQSVKKGAEKTKENRLFSSGFEIFTREEKRYIVILGRDVAEELLRTQQPLSYMHVLKERVVQKIYQNFLRHFYPEQDTELEDLLLCRKPIGESQNTKRIEQMDVNDRRNCIDEFQRAFRRAHFFAKREGVEFEWLIWLQETVLKSIVSTRDRVGLALVTEILSASIEFTPEQLFSWTTMSRPHRWIDDALVNSLMNAIAQFKPSARNAGDDQQHSLKSDLQFCLKSHQQNGRTVLNIFLRKLEQEAKLNSAGDPISLPFLTGIVADLKVLQRIDDIGRFRETSLRQWGRLIRHARLADVWPSSLTDQLTTILDRRLGHDKTDRFLQRFNLRFINSSSGNVDEQNHEKILDDMLKNLSKYPWIVDQFFVLANEEEVRVDDDHLWEFIRNPELIEKEKENASKANLNATKSSK
uniref:Uncharacterized protein n=1 Tax=Daphnia galeata TaxID=27404 RepID=A0A8J2RPQ8_9CRUS|nr:unnamed protein product [Daphnia galeata]